MPQSTQSKIFLPIKYRYRSTARRRTQDRQRRASSGKVLKAIEVRSGSRYRQRGNNVVVSECEAVEHHEGVYVVVTMDRHSFTQRPAWQDSDLTDGVE